MQSVSAGWHYRGFISYSQKDKDFAREIHKKLEGYVVPKDLRRRDGYPALPRRLGVFFLDRLELPASANLLASIQDSLAKSEFLIVLCSPHSAKSPHVDEEVRYFKALGREERIISLIVPHSDSFNEGHSPVKVEELFPPSLMLRFGPDGKPTGDAAEPLAGDLRSEGDGKEFAFLKIAAALLKVDLGVLKDRHALMQRQRAWRFAGFFAGLVVIVSGLGWRAKVNGDRAERNYEQAVEIASVTLEQAGNFANHYGVPRDAAASMLEAAEERLQDLVGQESDNKRLRLSFVELQVGFSDHYKSIGDTGAQLRAAERARKLALDASAYWPKDAEVLRQVGNAQEAVGHAYLGRNNTDAALTSFTLSAQARQQVIELAFPTSDRLRDLSRARANVGEALKAAGRYGEVLSAYEVALGPLEQALGMSPDSLPVLRTQAGLQQRIAKMQRHLAHPVEAVQSYERALMMFEELRKREPTQRSHLLSISEIRDDLGQLHHLQGDLVKARAAYQQVCQTADEVMTADPANVTFHVSGFWCRYRLGEVEADEGNMGQALLHYRRALGINNELLARDGKSSQRLREGAAVRTRLGEMLTKQGSYMEADANLQAADRLLQQLQGGDPGNLEWISLGAANDQSHGVVLARGNQPESARQRLERAVSRGEYLVQRVPGDVYYQFALSDHRIKLAEFEAKQGRTQQACALFEQVLQDSRSQPNATDPEWVELQGHAQAGLRPCNSGPSK
jgi:tetratricopeptide (TPR) repeat protein